MVLRARAGTCWRWATDQATVRVRDLNNPTSLLTGFASIVNQQHEMTAAPTHTESLLYSQPEHLLTEKYVLEELLNEVLKSDGSSLRDLETAIKLLSVIVNGAIVPALNNSKTGGECRKHFIRKISE